MRVTTCDLRAVEDLRARVADAAFRPVPIYTYDLAHLPLAQRGKRPKGSAWQERARRSPPEAASAAAEPDALNTGILCDGLRAIDVDIDDQGSAARVRALAVAMLGEAPMRLRGNSPRVLLLYRAAEGEPPKCSVLGTKGKVEVLGRGQQFAAFGTHASGAALVWTPVAPGELTREDLTAVTEEQVSTFLRAAMELVGAAPNGSRGVPPARHGLLPDGDRARCYAVAALRRAVGRLATAPEGSRNDTLNAECFALTRFVPELLSASEIADALAAAALVAGLTPRETERTLASALRAGGAA